MVNLLGHALFGLGLGGYFFYQGIRLWRDKRDIQNKPVSKIRSLAMGDVEVYGQVKAEKHLKAPYSGCDCVYFNYKIEVPDRNGWRVTQKGEESTIFYIDDGTDRLMVNPQGAAFYGPN